MVTGSDDNCVRTWTIYRLGNVNVVAHDGGVLSVGVNGDGIKIVSRTYRVGNARRRSWRKRGRFRQ